MAACFLTSYLILRSLSLPAVSYFVFGKVCTCHFFLQMPSCTNACSGSVCLWECWRGLWESNDTETFIHLSFWLSVAVIRASGGSILCLGLSQRALSRKHWVCGKCMLPEGTVFALFLNKIPTVWVASVVAKNLRKAYPVFSHSDVAQENWFINSNINLLKSNSSLTP